MRWVAWKMLTGDRAKYLGTVFGVAFGVLLISQQVRARTDTGHFWQSILIGLDDQSLVGAPTKMLQGDLADLRRPDGVIIDEIGYKLLWPNEPITLGRELEMNDRRAVVVGICDVSSPFFTFPVIFSRYSLAMNYVPPQRRQLSFVVGRVAPDQDAPTVLKAIEDQTGLRAYDNRGFFWTVVSYYLRNTGIPVNFGITIALGFLVGAAIAGQTFYLFTLENLKQFGALKAMGLANPRLIGMVLLQAAIVGLIGYCLGIGMTAAFFEFTADLNPNLRGLHLLWEIAVGTAVTVVVIILIASMMSLRKVLILEPAVVFRG
jgi:putative ABC transport system permease protein